MWNIKPSTWAVRWRFWPVFLHRVSSFLFAALEYMFRLLCVFLPWTKVWKWIPTFFCSTYTILRSCTKVTYDFGILPQRDKALSFTHFFPLFHEFVHLNTMVLNVDSSCERVNCVVLACDLSSLFLQMPLFCCENVQVWFATCYSNTKSLFCNSSHHKYLRQVLIGALI